MSANEFEEAKQALIDLIEWYRDLYHRSDFGHTEMIEEIKTMTNPDNLQAYEKIVDG